MTAPRILIVDDEPQIRSFLKISLEAHGFKPLEAANAKEALATAAEAQPALIILDLGLPDKDGMEVLKDLRSWSSLPVIVLSVRNNEREKVQAFDYGANDYVTKPFGIHELLARIRASLRNRSNDPEETLFKVGELEIDLLKHQVHLRGERIKLTPKEYKLLHVLVRHAGQVVTHQKLIQEVWGKAYGDDTQYLRIYIRQLRQKIELDRARDHYIHTEPGVGYRLEAEAR